jgi:hypothetical protein
MFTRLQFTLRAGLGLICAAIAIAGGWEFWVETRIWVPLDIPISLAQGHIRTPRFEVNVASNYWIGAVVEQKTASHQVLCWIGYEQCEDAPSVVTASWSVSSDERIVAHGSSAHYNGLVEDFRAIGRKLGAFECEKGYYTLDLDVLQDGSRINAFAPHLVVLEVGVWEHYNELRARVFLVVVLFAIAGIFLIVWSAILGCRQKLERFRKECSLTQPGPQARELQMSPGTQVLRTVSAGFWKRKPQAARRFSGMPSYGLIAIQTYLLLVVPCCLIQDGRTELLTACVSASRGWEQWFNRVRASSLCWFELNSTDKPRARSSLWIRSQ